MAAVSDAVRRARPDARYVYVGDDAAFPYGRLSEATLVARVLTVMERLVATHRPDLVVIACNTASTLVLPALRARHTIPIIGTVPAIKPSAESSESRLVSVLAMIAYAAVSLGYRRTIHLRRLERRAQLALKVRSVQPGRDFHYTVFQDNPVMLRD